jgi:hypothetical protein
MWGRGGERGVGERGGERNGRKKREGLEADGDERERDRERERRGGLRDHGASRGGRERERESFVSGGELLRLTRRE